MTGGIINSTVGVVGKEIVVDWERDGVWRERYGCSMTKIPMIPNLCEIYE